MKSILKYFFRWVLKLYGQYYSGPLEVRYIVERADWSIRHDGLSIVRELNRKGGMVKGRISVFPLLSPTTINHFGSQFQWVEWASMWPSQCTATVSFFHGRFGDDELTDDHIHSFLKYESKLEAIFVANRIVFERLRSWGVEQSKLFLIPIGVDLSRFGAASQWDKIAARRELGISETATVIGSFQKDGTGWSGGENPKLIKGPDLLVDVLTAYHARSTNEVIVLLTGPARGYVKRRLTESGITFHHFFVPDVNDLPKYYSALDLYLVCSRDEGGPKGLIEAVSAGIPVVTSFVGMAPELSEINGFVRVVGGSEIGRDYDKGLVEDFIRAMDNFLSIDKRSGINSSENTVILKRFDWKYVASAHCVVYEKIFEKKSEFIS